MDFRDSLFDTLHDIMEKDASVMVITNDMSAMRLDQIRTRWPDRVINIGIAEQNMMSVAGGLACCGKKIFGFGIGAHLATRGWEQIKLDICALNLPVMMIGVGGGLAYGNDGITHHATEDIALMMTLPNMAIYNPCDPVCVKLSVQHAYHRNRPSYLRLDKEQVNEIYTDSHDIDAGFTVLRDGDAATLISTGVIIYKVLAAAERLAAQGIAVRVVDACRLKPVTVESWREAIGEASHVFTIEEHNLMGGLGAQAAIYLATQEVTPAPRLSMLGLPDAFLHGSASRNWAHQQFGLTPDAMAARIRQVIAA